MHLTKTKKSNLKYFFLRLLIFLGLYTLISTFHSGIVPNFYGYEVSINDKWYFFLVYPILIFFVYLKWNKIREIPNYRNNILQTILLLVFALGFLLMPVKYLVFDLNMDPMASYFLPLYIGYCFLFLAVFNLRFVRIFLAEVIIFALILISYAFINVIIENYWQYFSKTITYVLGLILPLISSSTVMNADYFAVRVENFSVFIGPTCTGIYSMVTFALLFGMTLFLTGKTKKIRKFKASMVLLMGLATLFLFNIIRIAIIITVGAFYSQSLAINLFHEYLSSIFLIGIFALYLYSVIPKITVEKQLLNNQTNTI